MQLRPALDGTACLWKNRQVELTCLKQDEIMVEKWEKLESQTLSDYRIFKIRRDSSRSPRTGVTHDFYIMETGDWINVIPVTSEAKVVFIHQFRHGTEDITLEIPGGMADEDDDSLLESARRELREETGYTADLIVPIGSVAPNPAFLTNRCHTFLAIGARQVGQPQFDGSEDIRVQEIGLDQVPELITSGRITHALVVAAFYHFEKYQLRNPDWRSRPLAGE
jgi:ADP-ribose pyrophosphatase